MNNVTPLREQIVTKLYSAVLSDALERAVLGSNRSGDSRIGQILIQPVGWAEASRNAKAIFARLA